MGTEMEVSARVPRARAYRFVDRPWRRLAAEAPLALVLLASALFAFSRTLTGPAVPSPSEALDAKLIVLPAPPRPQPRPQPKPRRRPRPAVRQRIVRPMRALPVRQVERPVRQRAIQTVTAVATAAQVLPSPAPGPVGATPPPGAPLGDRDVLPAGNDMGAKAIFQPLPEIPDDLRHDAIAVVAIVRFEVAPDGSAKVSLLQATGNPQLNALLVASFQKWRFFPALRDGKPVASAVELHVPIEVK